MRGRLFDERDTSSSTKVVLINDALARKHWPGADPIGQRLKVYEGITSPDPIRLVIGVVRDVRETGVGTAAPPVMYVPQAQVPDDLNRLFTEMFPVSWIVRVSAYSAGLDQIIQAAFETADPLLATTSVQRMDQVIAGSLARQRFQMLVLGIFAGAALLLATSGVYGVLSYLVAQRTPEMAVRMALGARPWDLVRMIGVYGLRLVTLGVVIGLVCAAGFTRLLTAFLFAVRPIDLPTFGCVTLVLAIVALTACAVPARRASLVDPIVALRSE